MKVKDEVTTNHKVHLQYHTPRGPWYFRSWKNDIRQSGGLATNIGIHMFDLLLWLFGSDFRDVKLTHKKLERVAGSFVTPNADVTFDLSVESAHNVCREIIIDGERIDFTGNFTDLHTISYKKILAGEGFVVDDATPSVMLCETIRHM